MMVFRAWIFHFLVLLRLETALQISGQEGRQVLMIQAREQKGWAM